MSVLDKMKLVDQLNLASQNSKVLKLSIKIEMLRCFRAVVERGRLADAADSLGRTPSAVSMMLKQFEDHIGAPLFETSRKARLTHLGEQIFQEARRELDHFDRTLANIEGLSRAKSGNVRLAVTPSVATVILPPILQGFITKHPNVHIDIKDMSSTDVQNEIQNERADIGIGAVGPIAGYDRRLFFSDQFGVVCRKDNRLASNWDNLTWGDLVGENFIANGLCDKISDPAFVSILQASNIMVPNTTSMLALVEAGVGITLLPKLALPVDSTELVFLPLMDTNARREVWLTTQRSNLQSPAVSAMVAALNAANVISD
jgi:DNA-binding transcriptional LysR family regulator